MSSAVQPSDAHESCRGWLLCIGFGIVAMVCLFCEPIWSDGWYQAALQHEHPFSIGGIVDVAKHNYWHGNPRFGEVITYILYAPGWWHVVLSWIISAAAIATLATIGLGRKPRRGDALVVTTLLAMMMVAIPRFGTMFLFRPYHANYVAGALPSLILVAMCRCHLSNAFSRDWALLPWAFFLGILGGLGNEHTGPAFISIVVGCAYLAFIQSRRPPAWMIAAAVGLAVGLLALLFAPGQMERYNGAGKVGLFATIGSHSIGLSFIIVAAGPAIALWMLPWAAIAKLDRKRTLRSAPPETSRAFFAALAFAFVVGVTLLASPKHLPRLYFAPAALLCCTGAAWVTSTLSRRGRAITWTFNAIVIVVASASLVHSSLRTRSEYAERTALVTSAPPGAHVVVPPLSRTCWQWTLLDDWRTPSLRQFVAASLGLGSIDIAPSR
jgi:hypothetical protein